jgi:hypothetical protein
MRAHIHSGAVGIDTVTEVCCVCICCIGATCMGAIACPGMGAIIACPGMGAICCPDIAPGRVMHSRGGPYVRGVGRVGLVRRYLIADAQPAAAAEGGAIPASSCSRSDGCCHASSASTIAAMAWCNGFRPLTQNRRGSALQRLLSLLSKSPARR